MRTDIQFCVANIDSMRISNKKNHAIRVALILSGAGERKVELLGGGFGEIIQTIKNTTKSAFDLVEAHLNSE